ncbi:exodeoxyribonuclease VII large subunit [Sulfuritortus calidifontis]|uniref:Exodeoxyribonuclease 7 large subunit n=1 Tax=Sulfuritortus calidifontis TaxID=1914471 RepID=A0A4R3K0P0_9PROT|nr:exodeoxyribonuclease VII large subunit [Sulfuritortus calidifontis]TCS73819.1 exodeoxyribonuclease VII large subunit [Sulfuritortus calidifontis]
MNPAESDVLSVTQLNRLARRAIEGQIPLCWVAGEVSNFTRAPSGHWYFTLKDAQASVRCAMFKNRNQFLDWQPREGDHIEVRALATLYEARGEFQLSVETLRRAGLGALFEAFNRLKEKLEAEGLFDPARKKALPRLPQRIGIVTSAKAAALRDVLTTLRRRWPAAPVVLYPTLVQGTGAAAQIAAAIEAAGARAVCDVLLIVRGGGSIEDLWAFNEEAVARAIAACPIPTVSGVGHETDFTIADFVADLRAPTPTGAAQLATPDRTELAQQLDHIYRRLQFGQRRRLDNLAQRLDGLTRRLIHPAARLENRRRHLDHLARRLQHALGGRLQQGHRRSEQLAARLHGLRPDLGGRRQRLDFLQQRLQRGVHNRLATLAARLDTLASHLNHLNPQAVLERGYSIVRDGQGRIVRDSKGLKVGSEIEVTLAQGGVGAQVTKVRDA